MRRELVVHCCPLWSVGLSTFKHSRSKTTHLNSVLETAVDQQHLSDKNTKNLIVMGHVEKCFFFIFRLLLRTSTVSTCTVFHLLWAINTQTWMWRYQSESTEVTNEWQVPRMCLYSVEYNWAQTHTAEYKWTTLLWLFVFFCLLLYLISVFLSHT